jgi:P-type Cu2+ transporter
MHANHHTQDQAEQSTQSHDHATMMRNRFFAALVLTIPVLVYSESIQNWLNFTPPTLPGAEWIPLIFSTMIFLVGGFLFLGMARHEIADRQPGMMTLISLGITVAYGYSVAITLFPAGEETTSFFWELATLIDVMLLGHWVEMRSVSQAQGALDELAKLMPDQAERVTDDGATETVRVDQLPADDIVLVRPGASVPADGTITEGES